MRMIKVGDISIQENMAPVYVNSDWGKKMVGVDGIEPPTSTL